MVTRMDLVVKKWSFPHKNGDENGSRRQKNDFSASKCQRERVLLIYWFPRCETQVINPTLQTMCGLPLPKIGNQIKFNRRPSGT